MGDIGAAPAPILSEGEGGMLLPAKLSIPPGEAGKLLPPAGGDGGILLVLYISSPLGPVHNHPMLATRKNLEN